MRLYHNVASCRGRPHKITHSYPQFHVVCTFKTRSATIPGFHTRITRDFAFHSSFLSRQSPPLLQEFVGIFVARGLNLIAEKHNFRVAHDSGGIQGAKPQEPVSFGKWKLSETRASVSGHVRNALPEYGL
jgi:hypothetical protein